MSLTFLRIASVLGILVMLAIMFFATLVDGLPGTEAKYAYPNYHPLRWLAMKTALGSSVAVFIIANFLAINKRN
ncbi:hypothetical protein [uncultured Sulfitobacter sp.]|uniref:hypothetical protein n=1 Tax=uncultured Sulfitobacter sp. TaxID=191468 RepID=UPI002619A55A|nr:hypothetical protein [uncultured Sulfitobacter sp.]